jgi:hypothetical protein
MTKRQMPDLSKLLSVTAVPMTDAADPLPVTNILPSTASANAPQPDLRPVARAANGNETATANLENLNFKVPKSFRKRFRDCAYKADLKHNELLFAALDAWESLHTGKN